MPQLLMPICGIRTCTSSPCLSISNSQLILNGTCVVPNEKRTSASVKPFSKLEEVVRKKNLSLLRNLVFHIQQPFPLKNITSDSPKALHDCRRRVVLDQGSLREKGAQTVGGGGGGGLGARGDPGTQRQAGGGGVVGGGEGAVCDTGTEQQTGRGSLVGRVVAFTTPLQYAGRFEKLLREEGAEPLWCPTIVTEQSEQTRQELENVVGRALYLGELKVHGVAFTSRAGIRAFSDVLNGKQLPLNSNDSQEGLERVGTPFIVAALGKDAELLQELNVVADRPGIAMVVPAISTPQALVESLGKGNGRKILCPVPTVEGLEEPPVVPQFLQELRRQGWDPVRVNSYVTRWLGKDCAKPLLVKDQFRSIDALVFTSTAEIEGLLKSCASLGLDGAKMLQRGSRKVLVACHGPVTTLGAQRLGVKVDVVGKEFQSFAGVIKALGAEFKDIT